MVVREAPEHIRELIDWGTHFDEEDGEMPLGREGGHSHHRIVHALGDATGQEVMRAMIERTRDAAQRADLGKHVHDRPAHARRRLPRRARLERQHGEDARLGQADDPLHRRRGQIYRETTNPAVATGDGHAIAYRAGAELRDMEFMQFHPTVLYIAGSSRSLITEAMRGEGARLVDRTATASCRDYDARAELAPRDVVSQAIVSADGEDAAPLRVSRPEPPGRRRSCASGFPASPRLCRSSASTSPRDRIPVRPGAHYMIGGVTVDLDGRTTLPGLWAAGEVTSSGLHGANRLASNSLLEGLVYGAHAGAARRAPRSSSPTIIASMPLENPPSTPPAEPLDLADIRNSLKSLMWRAAGVRRSGRSCWPKRSKQSISWCRYVLARQFDDPDGWELQNMLTVARVMIEAALLREESRGVHLRTDFPKPDDAHWNKHLWFERSEAERRRSGGERRSAE